MSKDKNKQQLEDSNNENTESQEEKTPEQLVEEYKIGWQRAQADYQNLVKEMDAKKSELVVWSRQMIIEDFIPVYDNFKKAFASKNGEWGKAEENWAKGIEFIMKQFEGVLKGYGVEEVETVGKAFDPEVHEAVGEESSEEYEEGRVVKEVDAGYKMGDKVIKPAKVIICKKT